MGNTLTRLKEWFHEKLHTEEEQERHRQQLRAEELEREQAWDEFVRDWDALQEEAAEVGWIFLEAFEEGFRQWRPRLS